MRDRPFFCQRRRPQRGFARFRRPSMDVFDIVRKLHLRLRARVLRQRVFYRTSHGQRYDRSQMGRRDVRDVLQGIPQSNLTEILFGRHGRRSLPDRPRRSGRKRRIPDVLRHDDRWRRLDAHNDEPGKHRRLEFARIRDDIQYSQLRLLELRGKKRLHRKPNDEYDSERRDTGSYDRSVSKNDVPMFWRFDVLRNRQHVDIPAWQHFPAFCENGDDDPSHVDRMAILNHADVHHERHQRPRVPHTHQQHLPFGAVRSRDFTPVFGLRTHRARRPRFLRFPKFHRSRFQGIRKLFRNAQRERHALIHVAPVVRGIARRRVRTIAESRSIQGRFSFAREPPCRILRP